MQDFIELGVDGLGIAMLGTLDNERHGPCGQGGSGMPLEGFRRKQTSNRRPDLFHMQRSIAQPSCSRSQSFDSPGERQLHAKECPLKLRR